MFALQLLHPPLADHLLVWIQMSAIGSPAVGVKTTNTQWREQRLEFHQRQIRTAAKGIGHDPAGLLIERLPQPPRLLLAADKGLHFIQFSLRHLVDDDRER